MSGNGVLIPEVKLGRDVFTTGQVARMLGVAPRTVAKFCDLGRLRCHRVLEDRRITRVNLIAFLKEQGIPLGTLAEAPVTVLVGLATWMAREIQLQLQRLSCFAATDGFGAGVLVAEKKPAAVVVDFALGRNEALRIAGNVRAMLPEVRLLALANEDERDEAAVRTAGYDVMRHKPVAAEDVVMLVEDGRCP